MSLPTGLGRRRPRQTTSAAALPSHPDVDGDTLGLRGPGQHLELDLTLFHGFRGGRVSLLGHHDDEVGLPAPGLFDRSSQSLTSLNRGEIAHYNSHQSSVNRTADAHAGACRSETTRERRFRQVDRARRHGAGQLRCHRPGPRAQPGAIPASRAWVSKRASR